MKKRFKHNKELYELDVNRQGGHLTVSVNDHNVELDIEERLPAKFILRLGDQIIPAYTVRVKDDVFVQVYGRQFTFKSVEQDDAGLSTDSVGIGNATSPMPGSVIKILVAEGDEVKQHQALVIVEAMKMENEARSPANAIVDKILVEVGQQVGAGQDLIQLVALEET